MCEDGNLTICLDSSRGFKVDKPLRKDISNTWVVKVKDLSKIVERNSVDGIAFSVGVVQSSAETRSWPVWGFDRNGWGVACWSRWGFIHLVHDTETVKKVGGKHLISVGDEFELTVDEGGVLSISLNGEDLGSIQVPKEEETLLYPAVFTYLNGYDSVTAEIEMNPVGMTFKPAKRG